MFELQGKYAKATVYTDLVEESALSQIQLLLNQPMFEGAEIAIMPDVHAGKGCVIGFTCKLKKKMIVPNLVGIDIGCGALVCLFDCNMPIDLKAFDEFIRENIPFGFNVNQEMIPYFPPILKNKIEVLVKNVDPGNQDRHLKSLLSLGGGNHMIELGQDSQGVYALTIHTGSRNLGLKTCKHFQDLAELTMDKQREALAKLHKTATTAEEHVAIQQAIEAVPKIAKELAYLQDDDFDDYMSAMRIAQEFAEENRLLMMMKIKNYLRKKHPEFYFIDEFDTIHNYIEEIVNPDNTTSYVIRKGAIRANEGEMVAIPLNMRDGVILGKGKGNPAWNCSAPHGAGRIMSRSAAKEAITLEEFQMSMSGIASWSVNTSTIDEAPMAYKPAQEIIDAIGETVEILTIVKPIYNFKSS